MRRARATRLSLFGLGLVVLSSVQVAQVPERRLLVIGIDGVRSDALVAASTPHLDALVAGGAVTYDAVAGGAPSPSDPAHQATSSGPGWGSLLTGVWADKHGFYSNGDFSPGGGDLAGFPHFFQRVRDRFPSAVLSSIVQWHPINQVMLQPFPGLATFVQNVANSGQAVEDAAVAHLATADPHVLFLHFDDVDHAGHAHGFATDVPQYMSAIEQTDAHIGDVLAALASRPGYSSEDWLVLVTTDHGGEGTSHGGHSPAERAIWIIASGGDAAHEVISPGPGHTAIATTGLIHLGIAPKASWQLVDDHGFGLPQPQASHPTPVDGAQHQDLHVDLDWLTGADATAKAVYLGTSPTLGPADLVAVQSATELDPGLLTASTTYYWRVDTETGQGTTVGQVWSFETIGDLADDLVVHLALDGDATDQSGAGNDGSIVGSPTFGPGQIDQAIELDASGDHVSLGTPADLRFGTSTDFSVALWVRTPGWSSDPALLSNKDWASGSNTGWILACDPDGQRWQWNYAGAGSPRLDFDAIAVVADGEWHHLAVTHDRDGDATFYQDGVRVGQVSLVGQGSIDSFLPTAVGQDGTETYPDELTAEIDDVRIWRRVVGEAEIRQLHTAGWTSAWSSLPGGSAGTHGVPVLSGAGPLAGGTEFFVSLTQALGSAPGLLVVGASLSNTPLLGAVLVPSPTLVLPLSIDAAGEATVPSTWPASAPDGASIWFQAWAVDPVGPAGVAASDGLVGTAP